MIKTSKNRKTTEKPSKISKNQKNVEKPGKSNQIY